MAVPEEQAINLLVDVKGTDVVADLTENLRYTRSTLDQLRAAYERGDVGIQEYIKTGARLAQQERELTVVLDALEAELHQSVVAIDPVELAMAELGEEAERTATKLKKVGDAAGKAARSGANMGRTMLESGRIVQDFYQGGMLGILNNIEGFTMALGLGSGLAGALTIVGVTASIVGPQLAHWGKSLIDGTNKVPEAVDRLEGLEDKLKRNKKALEEMRDQTSLTNSELAEFNKLTKENVDLEAERDKLKKEKKDQDDFKESLDQDKSKEAHARGSAFKNAAGGHMKEIYEKIQKSMSAEAEDAIERERQRAGDDIQANFRTNAPLEEQKAFAEKRMAEFNEFVRVEREGTDRLARELMQRLAKGDKSAMDTLLRLIHNERDGVAWGDFEQEFVSQTEEGKAAKKEALKNQKQALETIGKSKGIDTEADKAAAQAAGRENDPEKRFAAVKDGIMKALESKLKAMGVDATGDQVNKVAETMAKAALDRLTKETTAQQKRAIHDVERSGAIKGLVDGYAKVIRKQDWDAEEQFDELKRKIVEELTAQLKERGVRADGEAVGEAAGRVAKEALGHAATGEKKAKTKAETEEKKRDAGVKKDLDAAEKTVNETPVDEIAAAQAAALRAQGGVRDERTGKIRRLTEEQQFQLLVRQLMPMIRQMFPNANQLQVGGLASRVASKAFDRAGEAAQRASVDLAGQGLTATQQTQQAQMVAMNAMGLLALQAAQTQAQGRRLADGYRRLTSQIHNQMRSAQTNGNN